MDRQPLFDLSGLSDKAREAVFAAQQLLATLAEIQVKRLARKPPGQYSPGGAYAQLITDHIEVLIDALDAWKKVGPEELDVIREATGVDGSVKMYPRRSRYALTLCDVLSAINERMRPIVESWFDQKGLRKIAVQREIIDVIETDIALFGSQLPNFTPKISSQAVAIVCQRNAAKLLRELGAER